MTHTLKSVNEKRFQELAHFFQPGPGFAWIKLFPFWLALCRDRYLARTG